MKFRYEYRTSDNVRHEGIICAASREAAFAALKSRGVRPSVVVVAPGLLNRMQSWGWRWFVPLVAFLGLLVVLMIFDAAGLRNGAIPGRDAFRNFSTATVRHQIYGDPEVLQRIECGGLDLILTNVGDRVLAAYAQPGRSINACLPRDCDLAMELEKVVGVYVEIGDNDEREICELKQIINGMKDELDAYLAVGTGTLATYLRRLDERFIREKGIVESVYADLQGERDVRVWDEKNAQLRRIGLRPISLPVEFYTEED